MDNSDDAFRAVKKIVEIVKNQNFKEKNIGDIKPPEIIAFHSTEHRKLSEKLALYVPSSFGSTYSIPPTDYKKIQEEHILHGNKILKKTTALFDKNKRDLETQLITDEKPEDYIGKAVKEEDIDLVVLVVR